MSTADKRVKKQSKQKKNKKKKDKELSKLIRAYKKGELKFDSNKIAETILQDMYFRRGFTKE